MRAIITISDLKKTSCWRLNQHLEEVPVKKKWSKYGNEIIEFDGKKFRSIKEQKTYLSLRMLATAGEIQNLRLQVPYELNPGGTHSLKYYADFVYEQNGETIVVDAKGYRTQVYKKKARLMLEVHGIKIKEV